ADEDKKKKEEIEIINQADSLVFQYEKILSDIKGKVDDKEIADIDKEMKALKALLDAQPRNGAKIKEQLEKTQKLFNEAATKLYAKAAEAQQGNATQDSSKKDDTIVDADYKVDEEHNKKDDKKSS